MKNHNNKIFCIKTIGDRVRLAIQNGTAWPTVKFFAAIDGAIAYVLPIGDRNSQLFVNGFEVIPYAWTESSPSILEANECDAITAKRQARTPGTDRRNNPESSRIQDVSVQCAAPSLVTTIPTSPRE
jgi:hypothetical protein